MPTILNDFLRRLRERALPGVSLTKVAVALAIKKEYLSRVELGLQRAPSEAVFERMMDVYGCGAGIRPATRLLLDLATSGGLQDDGLAPASAGIRLWEHLGQEPGASWCASYGNRIPLPRLQGQSQVLVHPIPVFNELLHRGTWIHEDALHREFLRLLSEHHDRYRLQRLDLEGDSNTYVGRSSSFRLAVVNPFSGHFRGLMCFGETSDGMVSSSDADRLAEAEGSFSADFQESYAPEEAIAVIKDLRESARELRGRLATLGDSRR